MIQSLQRAFRLMEVIADAPRGARLSELADAVALNRSTTHNLLATLQELGYVDQPARGGVYTLTDRFAELARGAGAADELLRERLRPVLEELTERTRETCYLGVPVGNSYQCLDAVEARTPLRLTIEVGGREPLLDSAIGHALLSARADLRERVGRGDSASSEYIADAERDGYALDLGGFRPDISCVAVPVEENGQVRAALGIAGPTSRLPEEQLREIAGLMRELLQGG